MKKLSNEYLLTLSPAQVYKLLIDGNITRFPNKFWTGEDALNRAADVTVCLIDDVLKWSEDDLKSKLGIRTFKDNKLLGMINVLFKGSSYNAIENAYPGRYKAWDFASVPRGYWNKESVKEVTQWIAENGTEKSLQTTKKILRLSQSNMVKKGLVDPGRTI